MNNAQRRVIASINTLEELDSLVRDMPEVWKGKSLVGEAIFMK
jgi:hypothetical protein